MAKSIRTLIPGGRGQGQRSGRNRQEGYFWTGSNVFYFCRCFNYTGYVSILSNLVNCTHAEKLTINKYWTLISGLHTEEF